MLTPRRLRRNRTSWTSASVLLGSLSFSAAVRADIDINPPLPNIMLLVDTSGSMEFKTDGTKTQCDQVDATLASSEPTGTSERSRWINLVEVLTGDINQYHCYTQDRRSTAFRDEYRLSSTNPYDYNYVLPFHRALSGSSSTNYCTLGPGDLPTDPFAWGSTPFKFHAWDNTGTSCSSFQQSQTGLLDSFKDLARFGLMTFDSLTNAGTGLSSGTSADPVSGVAGNWSYFLDWKTNASCSGSGANPSCATGQPANCSVSSQMEVGARNAAAPPWEGRMIPFGNPTSSVASVITTNDLIQKALLSMRPFGATPINGMLQDARDFFLNDTSTDPAATTCDATTGVGCFGPKYDGYAQNGCRDNFIILLTDGEPNLDLRPYCEGTSGACPYSLKSDEIAAALASPTSGHPIKTYVIGFAVSTGTDSAAPVDCTAISAADFDPATGICGTGMRDSLKACCSLAKIAYYGGTNKPFFATNVSELRASLSAVLSAIVEGTTSRTVPVFAGGVSPTAGGGYSFLSSFSSKGGQMWRGTLERKRTVCESGQAVVKDVSASLGDEFADNVNAADLAHPRTYYSVLGNTTAGTVYSDRSIRPNIGTSDPDGVGTYSGTLITGTNNSLAGLISPEAMTITAATCAGQDTVAIDATACKTRILNWEIGVTESGHPSRAGNVFGDIFHSTPAVVGPPSENVRDESYDKFAAQQVARPLMLYTATNDGQLHAFKVDKSPAEPPGALAVNQKVNNEVWSFFPPAVLPRIASQYPSTHQVLLDGAPVVKDVVFQRDAGSAQAGTATWRTVLVGGFGGAGGGYYALDVTDPLLGPQFLWQLTTDSTGRSLFGATSGTPTITSLYFDPSGGSNPKEYAVAILPGGDGAAAGAGPCTTPTVSRTLVSAAKPARSDFQCWGADPARSVTIVNLQTGAIIRTFRQATDSPSSILAMARDDAGLYPELVAPITGQATTYPSIVGSVADRAFVGDREGLMWRLKLSSTNPQKWTMRLWFDAFTGQGAAEGQPIQLAPILSVDNIGNVVALFATGDQNTVSYVTGEKNYLWSVTEKVTDDIPFRSTPNWWKPFLNGERVAGPMTLFSSVLYYSYFKPALPTTTGCSGGLTAIFGDHYRTPQNALDLSEGGARQYTESFTSALVFGVGITQQPSCQGTDPSFSDPYLGSGTHVGLGDVSTGKFQLMVQTGTGGSHENNATTKTRTVDLAPPISATRIDSWAAIIE